MKTPTGNPGLAAKTYAYSVLAGVLSLILYMSVLMVQQLAFTTVTGVHTEGDLGDGRTIVVEDYSAVGDTPARRVIQLVDKAGQTTVLQDVTISDPETDDGGESILKDYPVVKSEQGKLRSDPDPLMKTLSDWVAQILMLILFLAFPYSNLWYAGDRDRNSAQFGHIAEDKWRGAKIGLMADIPAIGGWGLLLLSKLTGVLPNYPSTYRLMNVCFLPYLDHLFPHNVTATAEVGFGAVFAMLPALFSLPLITGVGYLLGYKGVSLKDRLVYASTGKKAHHRTRR